jgi:hypothetical protein
LRNKKNSLEKISILEQLTSNHIQQFGQHGSDFPIENHSCAQLFHSRNCLTVMHLLQQQVVPDGLNGEVQTLRDLKN